MPKTQAGSSPGRGRRRDPPNWGVPRLRGLRWGFASDKIHRWQRSIS